MVKIFEDIFKNQDDDLKLEETIDSPNEWDTGLTRGQTPDVWTTDAEKVNEVWSVG